jgi:hypothetical protein
MRFCIISGACLSRTHGTGAQLLRIFAPVDKSLFHLYYSSYFGLSQLNNSFLLEDPRYWKPLRGKRLLIKLQQILRLSWWQGNKVRRRLIQSLIKSHNLKYDVAYVVVVSEEEAQRAVSLLQCLNCPYVVNIMDLLHVDGLIPDTMIGFKKLLKNASFTNVLTPEIKTEVEKFEVDKIEIVPFCQDPSPLLSQPPSSTQNLRIIITGAIHKSGADLIAQAWPGLLEKYADIELIYLGTSLDKLPASLKQIVNYPGYISDPEEYQQILVKSHLAYLPGPREMDCYGRFSIPSRLSDFFMAGLPILANVAPSSATENFLKPLVPDCVQFTRTSTELLQAIEYFTCSDSTWQQASKKARTFAMENLSVEVIRRRVFERLLEASKLRH